MRDAAPAPSRARFAVRLSAEFFRSSSGLAVALGTTLVCLTPLLGAWGFVSGSMAIVIALGYRIRREELRTDRRIDGLVEALNRSEADRSESIRRLGVFDSQVTALGNSIARLNDDLTRMAARQSNLNEETIELQKTDTKIRRDLDEIVSTICAIGAMVEPAGGRRG